MNDYLILAAGRGARLWPITADIPKTMIRILKKPLLEWIIEGILPDARKIGVVVGYKRGAVENYFAAKPYADKIVFIEQREQRGTGHAVLQARDLLTRDFIIGCGDHFFAPSFYEVLRREAATKKFFFTAKNVEDASELGVWKTDESGNIVGISEKAGGGPGLANLNWARVPNEFFSFLERVSESPRGEIELTDAYADFARQNDVELLKYEGFWSGIEFFFHYLDANAFALRELLSGGIEGEVEKGVELKGKIFVGKDTLVRSGTRVEGPAFIGENCVIGPHAFIRAGTTIEDHCRIGSSEVKNSIVMSYSNAPHYTYIGDSVICEDVNLGAGTTTANLRFDDAPIPIFDPKSGKKISSGRRKLGCVIGAQTRVGINASINCGVAVGRKCRIYPHTLVKANLADESICMGSEYSSEERAAAEEKKAKTKKVKTRRWLKRGVKPCSRDTTFEEFTEAK
ncbi:MAG: sugar phosphate nucleotidyltransferase [Candidatus Norongarragalinales archaeon]